MSYKWKIILVTIAGTFMIMIDSTIVNIALPHILSIFNDTIDTLQFVASAYLIATAVTAPLAAYAVTRFGIKKIYLGAQFFFLVGSMLCGLAWDTNSLILFRIIQGLSGGILMPIAMTLIFTTVPKEERGTAMGIFGIPMILAPTIGTTLGGYLVEYLNWRFCFYVNVPIVIVAFTLGLIWLKDNKTDAKIPLDYKGFFLAALGFGGLLYAFSYAPSWGWGDTRVLSIFALSAVSIALWAIVESKEKVPMLNLRVFRFKGYSLGTGLNFIITVGLYSSMLLLPLFLQNLRGLGAFESGLLMIPQALGAMVGSFIGGRLYDKIGPRWPTILGLTITGLITLQLANIDVTTSNNTLSLLLMFRGMGMGFAMMPVMTFSLQEVPNELTAQASAISNVVRPVFAGLGIAVFASLLDSLQKSNLAQMVQLATPDSGVTLGLLSAFQVGLQQAGMSLEAARQTAVFYLYQMTYLRAYVASFDKVFFIGAIVIFIGIIPALFLYNHNKNKKAGQSHAPVEM